MIIILFSTGGRDVYDSVVFLLLNPIVFLEEFFMLAMTGESLFSGELSSGLGFFGTLLSHGPLWCIVSGLCMLGLSLFFMFLAAKRIDPLTDKVRKLKKKQPVVQSAFIPKEVNSQDAGKEPAQLDFVKAADGAGETVNSSEAVNNVEAVNGSEAINSIDAGNEAENG